MSIAFDEQWIRDYCARTGKQLPAELYQREGSKHTAPQAALRTKYGNEKVEVDGELMDSKHEARVYLVIKKQVEQGLYRAVARQVAFLLPGGVRYVADFVTMNNDGTYTVFDAKSEVTQKDKVYRIKKRLMKNCLGIEIHEA